jgi:hypothetical protein
MQHSTEPSGDVARSEGPLITHAQPLVLGQEEGTFVAQPLLSPAEAEIEAILGIEEGHISFSRLDEIELGLYTHHLTVLSGPAHLCRHYLVRLAR